MLRHQNTTLESDAAAAAKRFKKIDSKQIMSHSRIVPAGGAAINIYRLDDGTIVRENDAGEVLTAKAARPKYTRRTRTVTEGAQNV